MLFAMRPTLYTLLMLSCCACGYVAEANTATVPLEQVLTNWEPTMAKASQKVYESDTLVVFCSPPTHPPKQYWCVWCYRYFHGGWVNAELVPSHSEQPSHWRIENDALVPYRGDTPVEEVKPIPLATPNDASFLLQMLPQTRTWTPPEYENTHAELPDPHTLVVRATEKLQHDTTVYHAVLRLKDSRWHTVGAVGLPRGFDTELHYRLCDNKLQCVDAEGLPVASIALHGALTDSPQYVQMHCDGRISQGHVNIQLTNTLNRSVRLRPGDFILSHREADGTLHYGTITVESAQEILLPPHGKKSLRLKTNQRGHQQLPGQVYVSYHANLRKRYTQAPAAHEWVPTYMESAVLPAIHPTHNEYVYPLCEDMAVHLRFDHGFTSGIDSTVVYLTVYRRVEGYWYKVGQIQGRAHSPIQPNMFRGCCRLQDNVLQYGEKRSDKIQWAGSVPLHDVNTAFQK